jgi:hypothetical protein
VNVADERLRRLERDAANGDAQAAESLYWGTLRTMGTDELLDRMIETVLTVVNREAPSVWDKLRWLRGLPPEDTGQEQLAALRAQWSRVNSSKDLHRVPRQVRQAGMTVYAQEEREVYMLQAGGQWARVCSMSRRPPTYRFMVFATLSARDEYPGSSPGLSCLVLENGGVYEADRDHNPFRPPGGITWRSCWIERKE